MEAIDLHQEGLSTLAPRDGYVLMVRFKLQDRNEYDTIFCDYGLLTGRTFRFFNCKCKTFVIGQLPRDHSIKVGAMDLAQEHVVDIHQLPVPAWYYRLEEDAQSMTESDRMVLDVGVLDIFSELTGSYE